MQLLEVLPGIHATLLGIVAAALSLFVGYAYNKLMEARQAQEKLWDACENAFDKRATKFNYRLPTEEDFKLLHTSLSVDETNSQGYNSSRYASCLDDLFCENQQGLNWKTCRQFFHNIPYVNVATLNAKQLEAYVRVLFFILHHLFAYWPFAGKDRWSYEPSFLKQNKAGNAVGLDAEAGKPLNFDERAQAIKYRFDWLLHCDLNKLHRSCRNIVLAAQERRDNLHPHVDNAPAVDVYFEIIGGYLQALQQLQEASKNVAYYGKQLTFKSKDKTQLMASACFVFLMGIVAPAAMLDAPALNFCSEYVQCNQGIADFVASLVWHVCSFLPYLWMYPVVQRMFFPKFKAAAPVPQHRPLS